MSRAKSGGHSVGLSTFHISYMVNYIHSNAMISLYGNYSKIIRTCFTVVLRERHCAI